VGNRAILNLLCALLLGGFLVGCGGTAARVENEPPKHFNPQQVQSQTIAFASRYITASADTYSEIQMSATAPEAQLVALRRKIVAAYGAIGCVVEFNPIAGLMDMAVMITLSRQIAEKPWNGELFGPDNAAKIVSMLKLQETDVWNQVGPYLTKAQIAELHGICDQWMQDHPDRQYAINVGLADLQQSGEAKAEDAAYVGSIFGLVGLDPFSEIDPAVKQIEQSRVLAERAFFELRHMPMLMGWQADALYLQMMATPQTKQFLTDTSKVAASTTRFTESTQTFSDASRRFADSIESFRLQLPDQREKLIEQLNQLLATQREAAFKEGTTQVARQLDESIRQVNDAFATQRDAAVKQATTQVAMQRDETIKQIDSMLAAQQKSMAEHLGGAMDNSIDRLYRHTRSLLLIAAAAVLAVLLIYRVAGRKHSHEKEEMTIDAR
jgi:hypothetical protein